jgi:outer membrane protein assembly factor BamB
MKTSMKSTQAFFVIAAVCAASAFAGCGGASGDLIVVSGKPFSQETLNDPTNVQGQQRVLERLAKMPPPVNPDILVAATGQAEVTGMDLTSGKTWTYKHPLDHRPRIAGPLVVASGGGEVFALDGKTGAEKWRTNKARGKLIAAGSDGTNTALTLTSDEGSRLVIVGGDGSIKVDKTTEMPLTKPAVASGMVFVPWKALYVSVFDVNSGDQLATFVTDTETTQVRTIGGALFAGQGRLVRFDQDILKAKTGGSNLAVPSPDLPAVSRRDIYVPPDHDEKLADDAIDQTVLAGRPVITGPAGFAADRVYGGYYKIVMGWGAKDAKLAWVYTGTADVVAACAGDDGVVTVDEAGTVKLLAAANGAEAKSYSLGKAVMDADISIDALKIGSGNPKGDLSDQIKEAVTLPLNELATAQIYLVQQLASNPDEDATKVLLQVADAEKTANALKDEARKSIAARKNGAAAMEDMLARHANFLKDTRTPPVGPMATALAAMKDTKAAGLLLDQLLDPALPNRDLLDTAQGVSALATAAQMPGLQKFVQLYRGSATGNLALTDALGAIGAAILRVGGPDGKKFIVDTQKDALTDKDVKEVLQKQLDAAEPKKAETPKDEAKPEDDKGKKKKKKVDDDDEPVPAAIKAKMEKEKAEKAKKEKEKKDKEKADGGSTEAKPPTPATSGSATPPPAP